MTRATWIALAIALAMAVLAVRLSLSDSPTERADDYAPAAPGRAASPIPTAGEETSPSLPPIRVLLGGRPQSTWRVRIDGPYRVTALGDWKVLAQGDRLPQTDVVAAGKGIRIGGEEFPAGRLLLEALDSGTLHVGDARYRGHLHLLSRAGGEVAAVNVVPLEEYLAGVLPSEMPGSFPPAAQEAQTVAARTYAIYQMKTFGAAGDFDVYDSTRSQSYRGMETTAADGRRLAVESAASRRIVDRTRGLVLLYRGKLFCAFYSAVCGGHAIDGRTLGVDTPALVGAPCDGCQNAPNHRWRKEIPWNEAEPKLRQMLAASGDAVGPIETVSTGEPGGGQLPTIRFSGASGSAERSSLEVRRALEANLLSPVFTATREGDLLVVEGRGWGHGVGLCQWGARGLAGQGKSAAEILRHYYPGSELAPVR